MPSKPAKPTDWDEVKKTVEMVYRDYAAHVSPDSFPLTFPLDGRGWVAELKIDKKMPIK